MGYAEDISGRQQGDHHRVLRVGVDAAARATQIERVPEERRARGLSEIERRPSEEYAIAVGRRREWQDEDVRGLDALLLDAGGGDVHLVACEGKRARRAHARGKELSRDTDADATPSPRHPAQVIKATTELGDKVCGLRERV